RRIPRTRRLRRRTRERSRHTPSGRRLLPTRPTDRGAHRQPGGQDRGLPLAARHRPGKRSGRNGRSRTMTAPGRPLTGTVPGAPPGLPETARAAPTASLPATTRTRCRDIVSLHAESPPRRRPRAAWGAPRVRGGESSAGAPRAAPVCPSRPAGESMDLRAAPGPGASGGKGAPPRWAFGAGRFGRGGWGEGLSGGGVRSVHAGDPALVVEVDAEGGGGAAQARHGLHGAADQVDEAGAGRGADLADREGPAGGGSAQGGVGGEREVGLGDADRKRAQPVALAGAQLALGALGVADAGGAVDGAGDRLHLLLQ